MNHLFHELFFATWSWLPSRIIIWFYGATKIKQTNKIKRSHLSCFFVRTVIWTITMSWCPPLLYFRPFLTHRGSLTLNHCLEKQTYDSCGSVWFGGGPGLRILVSSSKSWYSWMIQMSSYQNMKYLPKWDGWATHLNVKNGNLCPMSSG